MVLEINSENLEQVLSSDGPVVIDFWAEWCCPCRRMSPVIDELAETYEGRAVVAKCNVEDHYGIAKRFSVESLPTILFIKNGEVAHRQVGTATKEALAARLEKLFS